MATTAEDYDSIPWIYRGRKYETWNTKYFGFVYAIRNKRTRKIYIGRKAFVYRRNVQTIDKSNNDTMEKYDPSDWPRYFGSNAKLHNDMKNSKPKDWEKIILRLCKTRMELILSEAKELINRDVLTNDLYYNDSIVVSISVADKTVNVETKDDE